MDDLFIKYLYYPEDPMINFYLGIWYETKGYYSPACSFYLRCLQFSCTTTLSYESLIRLYYCFNTLGSRDYTCEHLLKSAINTIPELPYAYFLLGQFYERKQNWMDMYTFSSICLDRCDFNNNAQFYKKIEFPGKYSIVFQKALSAWWYGKSDESRHIFQDLMINYVDELDQYYYTLVQNNISKIGTGPRSQSSVQYNKDLESNLKFSFNGIESIDHNYSQIMQDMFVLGLLDGKNNGTYLEIGSSHPFINNNTALLEKFGWVGIGIENNSSFYQQYINNRKNKVLNADATSINYSKILKEHFNNTNIIDYLQLDIEPCKNTFEALLSIPFDKYEFRVITYEHDYYIDMTRSYRNKSRNYLSSLGYILLFNDISTDNNSPFEDWWVKPELINSIILQRYLSINLDDKCNPIKQLMFK